MLSKQQRELQRMEIIDMTDEQLDGWIVACTKMQTIVRAKRARYMWEDSLHDALKEQSKR